MLSDQKLAIAALFESALKTIGISNVSVLLEHPKAATMGDLACTVALQCAKALKKNPRQVASELIAALERNEKTKELIDSFEVAGPGFINMKLTNSVKQQVVRRILMEGSTFGLNSAHKGQNVLLEYVSANPTGPLHLGHARQGALGDVLANIFKSQGWNVTREFYYNDAGVQIHNLAISVQARAKELSGIPVEFPENGYNGDYIRDIAKQYIACVPVITLDGNTIESEGQLDNLDLIRQYSVAYLRNEQDADLKALGVSFDNFYLESSLYSSGRVIQAVDAIAKAGKSYEKENALWFKSSDYGDDKDRVMRKADGSFTYFVPDVAYHLAKFERGYTRAINIQGSDHHGTIARVRAGIQAASGPLGLTIPSIFPEYMLHKMLRVLMDGNEVKMSKRAGTYVTLRDLVDWVGKDAARLFLVSRKPDAEFTFDIDLARSQSDENPVYYLQYAHARICSVLVQGQEKGFVIPTEKQAQTIDLSPLNTPSEFALMNRLSQYPEVLENSANDLTPHAVAYYLKELAADFHAFYNASRVLVDEKELRDARFALLLATRQVLRNGLNILGVSSPERLDRENAE